MRTYLPFLLQMTHNPKTVLKELEKVQQLLHLIQQLSTYEQHQDGIHVLLDHGLLNMISIIFHVRHHKQGKVSTEN